MLKIFFIVIVTALLTGFVVVEIKDNGTNIDIEDVTEKTTIVDDLKSEVTVPVIDKNAIIDLSNQDLTNVPSWIFDRLATEELNLSNNLFDGALQAEVRLMQNLRVLDLSNNQFTGVPAEVGHLENLEVLDLSNNYLTGLPYELGRLSNLKLLDLRGNNYSELDLEIIRKSLPDSVIIKID